MWSWLISCALMAWPSSAERAFWIAQIRKAPVRVITTWSLEIVDGMVVTTPENPAWAQVEGKYRDLAERIVAPLREIPGRIANP